MADRNEVHITNTTNGHLMSVDCWCEPVSIRWIKNKAGIEALVVEHDDETLRQHADVLNERNLERANPWAGNYAGAPWITRALTPPFTPPLLPPQGLL